MPQEIDMSRMAELMITEMYDGRRVDAIIFNEWRGYPERLEPRYENEPRILRYIAYDLDIDTNTWVQNGDYVSSSDHENTDPRHVYAHILNYLYRKADGQHVYSMGTWGAQRFCASDIDCPRCGHWSKMINNSRTERKCQDPSCSIAWNVPEREMIQPAKSNSLVLYRTDGAGNDDRRHAEVIAENGDHYVVSLRYVYHKGGYITEVQKGRLHRGDNGRWECVYDLEEGEDRHRNHSWLTSHFIVKDAKRFGVRIWSNVSMKNWHPTSLRVERLINQLENERAQRIAEDERRRQ